jgi:hypothetical protein
MPTQPIPSTPAHLHANPRARQSRAKHSKTRNSTYSRSSAAQDNTQTCYPILPQPPTTTTSPAPDQTSATSRREPQTNANQSKARQQHDTTRHDTNADPMPQQSPHSAPSHPIRTKEKRRRRRKVYLPRTPMVQVEKHSRAWKKTIVLRRQQASGNSKSEMTLAQPSPRCKRHAQKRQKSLPPLLILRMACFPSQKLTYPVSWLTDSSNHPGPETPIPGPSW